MFSALFFSGILFFSGCKKKENDLGLSVQPQGDQLTLDQGDTSTIVTYTTKGDSIRTDELNGSMVLGQMHDPELGVTSAEIYTQIRLESAIDFTNSIGGSLDSLVVDSAILYLVLDGYYGKLDAQNFEVYQLANAIYSDSNYYSTSTVPLDSTNLVASGQGLIKPDLEDFAFVDGNLTDKHILKIPLSINDFAWPIMNQSGTGVLDGNDASGQFVEWFKGICIRSTSTFNAGEGGLLYLDLIDAYSKISLYYRDTSGTVSQHDTISYDFHINSNCARFIHTSFDYTGTVVEQQLADSTLGQDEFYSQSLGGVRSKVYFPNILDYYSDSNVIVNKAELIIPVEYFILDNYVPPTQLYLIRTADDGSNAFLPDFADGGGGVVNYETMTYNFVITRYVNGLFSGQYQNLPLQIFQSGSGIHGDRVIMNGMNSSKKDKIRLKLTFTQY